MGDLQLSIGKGSIGYALYRKKGICISDSVADPHGAAIFRNIVSHRFCYQGIPIKNITACNHEKILAYLLLSYPVVNAWHPGHETCKKNRDTNVCFFSKFEAFLQHAQSCLLYKENFPPAQCQLTPDTYNPKGVSHS